MHQHKCFNRYLGVIILTCVAFIVAVWFRHDKVLRLSNTPIDSFTPANSTLGFGAIAPVSRTNSARRQGLIFAANITDINLTIPAQPTWTDEDVASLRAAYNSRLTYGSSLAWLGHLNALKWFLSTDLETVLILEDDVDWNIHLRSTQIPAAAAAVRLLTKTHSKSKNYWGPPESWDLLYLGHCGDFFPNTTWNNGKSIPHITFPDPTLPLPENLHPYTQKFLQSISIPPKNRFVHKTTFPLCTFGYAVTRSSARRLINDLANREPESGCLAYDVRIHEICRDDNNFKCLTVNPELMHHVDAESEIGNIDDEEKKDEDNFQERRKRETPNIACGARKSELFTEDAEVLDYLGSLIEEDGKDCPLPPDLETAEKDMRRNYPYHQ